MKKNIAYLLSGVVMIGSMSAALGDVFYRGTPHSIAEMPTAGPVVDDFAHGPVALSSRPVLTKGVAVAVPITGLGQAGATYRLAEAVPGIRVDAAAGTLTGTPTGNPNSSYRIVVEAVSPQGNVKASSPEMFVTLRDALKVDVGFASEPFYIGGALPTTGIVASSSGGNPEGLVWSLRNAPSWLGIDSLTNGTGRLKIVTGGSVPTMTPVVVYFSARDADGRISDEKSFTVSSVEAPAVSASTVLPKTISGGVNDAVQYNEQPLVHNLFDGDPASYRGTSSQYPFTVNYGRKVVAEGVFIHSSAPDSKTFISYYDQNGNWSKIMDVPANHNGPLTFPNPVTTQSFMISSTSSAINSIKEFRPGYALPILRPVLIGSILRIPASDGTILTYTDIDDKSPWSTRVSLSLVGSAPGILVTADKVTVTTPAAVDRTIKVRATSEDGSSNMFDITIPAPEGVSATNVLPKSHWGAVNVKEQYSGQPMVHFVFDGDPLSYTGISSAYPFGLVYTNPVTFDRVQLNITGTTSGLSIWYQDNSSNFVKIRDVPASQNGPLVLDRVYTTRMVVIQSTSTTINNITEFRPGLAASITRPALIGSSTRVPETDGTFIRHTDFGFSTWSSRVSLSLVNVGGGAITDPAITATADGMKIVLPVATVKNLYVKALAEDGSYVIQPLKINP